MQSLTGKNTFTQILGDPVVKCLDKPAFVPDSDTP